MKPDGTFEMKIGYEYSEKPFFTLKFHPGGSHQWNLIRETYGKNGEKLVGNYVETSGQSQHIKSEIDYTHEAE